MIVFVNENTNDFSINAASREIMLYVNDIVHEAEVEMLSTKYNYLVENGVEMPINEAEEKKDNIIVKLIKSAGAAIKKFFKGIIKKLKEWFSKLKPNKSKKADIAREKIEKATKDISEKFSNAETDLNDASNPNEVKVIVHDFTDGATKDANSVNDYIRAEVLSDTEKAVKDVEYTQSKVFEDIGNRHAAFNAYMDEFRDHMEQNRKEMEQMGKEIDQKLKKSSDTLDNLLKDDDAEMRKETSNGLDELLKDLED